MKIIYSSNYKEMSALASQSTTTDLTANPTQLICAATGNSPLGLYRHWAKNHSENPNFLKRARIIKLDEWGGIDASEPTSCETFIKTHLLGPLHISPDRYIAFNSNPLDPKKECQHIQMKLQKEGPIDLCILGLGQNGHIGFNEPALELQPNCHVVKLSPESLTHKMARAMKRPPSYGLSLGIADILQSKKIFLLVTGPDKKKTIAQLLSKQITTQLPASLLWMHPQVECYIDTSFT